MDSNRNLQALDGEGIAAWLNADPREEIGLFIRFYVMAQSLDDVKGRKPLAALQETVAVLSEKGRPVDGGFWLPFTGRMEFRLKGPRLHCQMVSESISDWAVFRFAQLVSAGEIRRLRCCPNCFKFFYCEAHAGRRFCSVNCRVSFWQKTAYGRQRHSKSMKDWRNNPIVRKRRARLKASKRILDSLGKRGRKHAQKKR
jgi:hypothetical protein